MNNYTTKYQLGLVSVSFRNHTPKEILKEMKKVGLSWVEWGSDIHAPKEDIEGLQELKKLQDAYGITCCSYGTYFRLGVTSLAELDEYIRAAKVLGTNILRLWCGNKNSEEYLEQERNELFAVCRKAAEIACREDVILCMECHGNTYTNTKEAALELMKVVDSPCFRMYWQPNQFRTEEENRAYIRLLKDYTKHVHVFHWKGQERLPLGEGIPRWKNYLKELDEVDRKPEYIGNSLDCSGVKHTLLLEFMPDDRLETLQEEAMTLRKIVGE